MRASIDLRVLALAALAVSCGGNVHEPPSSELGPACDPKIPAGCLAVNDCQVCVFVGSAGLCGHGCKSNADCGSGYGCRKTHNYSYEGACTRWTEDVGYCAELHAAFGALCAAVEDCQTAPSGCGICGQASGDSAYRCRKACGSDADCTAPQKCAAPPVTVAYVSLSACAKPERFCQ